jgi:hypothetical protein
MLKRLPYVAARQISSLAKGDRFEEAAAHRCSLSACFIIAKDEGAADAIGRMIDGLHSQDGAAGPIFRAFSARRLGLPVPRPRKLSLGYHRSRLRRCFPANRSLWIFLERARSRFEPIMFSVRYT